MAAVGQVQVGMDYQVVFARDDDGVALVWPLRDEMLLEVEGVAVPFELV